MTSYPQLPKMRPGPVVGGEKTYIVTEEHLLPDGDIIRRGFPSDGLSIPKIVQPLLGPHDGPGFGDGIAHDWRTRYSRQSRCAVDRLFLEEMKGRPVRFLRRRSLWLGVRAGGWKAWNRYRKGRAR